MTDQSFNFDTAVFNYYLKHGKPCTANELAEFAAVPISKVRKIISSFEYKAGDTTIDKEIREKNYGTIRCYRQVHAFEPTLRMMREYILMEQNHNQLKGNTK